MNKKVRWAGIGVLAAALFGGGIGVGSAVADPTVSEEYVALAADKDAKQTELDKQDDYVGSLQVRQKELEGQLAAARTRESDLKTLEATLQKREDAVAAAATEVQKREEAVKGPEAAKAASTIREGSWTVGRDVEPGTYTTSAPVTGRCYWGIYVSGTNGDDIVANDNVEGGQPTVTLQAGQDFKTVRCGSWSKLG